MPDLEARQAEQLRQDWRQLLACPGARRIIGNIIHEAAYVRSHYPGDPLATAFNEGKRAVGLLIMESIEQVRAGESAALLAEILQELHHEK